MIIDTDNVEVFRTYVDGGQDSLPHHSLSKLEYLPKSLNGAVLVTSRVKETAVELVEDNSSVLEVDPTDPIFALQLLRKTLPHDLKGEEEQILQVAESFH